MVKILTVQELQEIESKIDEIGRRAEILDPSNSIEAKMLEADDRALDHYLSVVETSYRKARIAESGLRLIHP